MEELSNIQRTAAAASAQAAAVGLVATRRARQAGRQAGRQACRHAGRQAGREGGRGGGWVGMERRRAGISSNRMTRIALACGLALRDVPAGRPACGCARLRRPRGMEGRRHRRGEPAGLRPRLRAPLAAGPRGPSAGGARSRRGPLGSLADPQSRRSRPVRAQQCRRATRIPAQRAQTRSSPRCMRRRPSWRAALLQSDAVGPGNKAAY